MKNTITYYEIGHGNGIIQVAGKYSFETEKQAVETARAYKSNPQSNNKHMTEENANYWKDQNYTVMRKTITVEEIITI